MSLTAHKEITVFHVISDGGPFVDAAFGLPILVDPTTAEGGIYVDKILQTDGAGAAAGLPIVMEPTTHGNVIERMTAVRTGPDTFRVKQTTGVVTT